MAKDAVETMGMLLPDDAGGRDAVHVAVISAVADEKVYPGQHVGLIDSGLSCCKDPCAGTNFGDPLGIVDPFLREPVWPGSRFWLFIYPRTITGLKHVWTHPDLPETVLTISPPVVGDKAASEQWLRDFCQTADCPSYETVMEAAATVASGGVVGNWHDGEFLHFDGIDAHGEIPPEFWYHVQVVLGKPIKGRRATSFSCAC
jgi:hypothetical protein